MDFGGRAWRDASVQAAGVVSSLSRDPSTEGEVLAGAGQTLSRQALAVVDPADVHPGGIHNQQPKREQAAVPRPSYGPSPAQLAARQVQLAMRAGGPSSHPGWIAALQQLRGVLAAIEAAQRARRELVAAGQLAGAQQALERVQHGVHVRYEGRDLDELREARLARKSAASAPAAPITARPRTALRRRRRRPVFMAMTARSKAVAAAVSRRTPR